MESLKDMSLLAKLHLATSYAGAQPSEEDLGSWASFQYDVLTTFVTYIIEICASHAWAQVIYTVCLPHAFACIHHEKEKERRLSMLLIRRIWTAVHDKERLLAEDMPLARKRALQQLMSDLAWRLGQVAREIHAACQNANWSERDEECRLFSYLLFAGPPNTKFYLEDAFSHMSDVCSRFARHMKMTKFLGLINRVGFVGVIALGSYEAWRL